MAQHHEMSDAPQSVPYQLLARNRALAEYAVRVLSELQNYQASVLDCPIMGRIAAQRVREIYYSHIQTRELSSRVQRPPSPTVLKEIAEAFPREDPLLLCWRVRLEDFAVPLSRDTVHQSYPVKALSDRSERLRKRLGQWFRVDFRRCAQHEFLSICNQILLEKTRRTSHDRDVAEAWNRIHKFLQLGPVVGKKRRRRRSSSAVLLPHSGQDLPD